MERYEAQSIGDVLRTLLEETSLQERMDELKAAHLWPAVVGTPIARLCKPATVKKGVMTVGVANASLRQELHMSRSRLRQLINEAIGKETILEIKFTS